jgi:pimeloyl-ACP methyl ester carboxylesterase
VIVFVIGVAGTWAWKSPWWQDGSDFWEYMRQHKVLPVRLDDKHPYRWSTELGGSWKFWEKRRGDWEAAGDSLYYYAKAMRLPEIVIICHSHGGQAAFYAAALGLQIDRLITVATPVRNDMQDVINLARPNIKQWLQVCDSKTDKVAWWGSFGDRKFGNSREFAQADRNLKIDGIGHSGLLSDKDKFPLWHSMGIIDFIRGEDVNGKVPEAVGEGISLVGERSLEESREGSEDY